MTVSIAGAILWGFELIVGHSPRLIKSVSIAGAILWGFEPPMTVPLAVLVQFQSQARFFGALSSELLAL